MNGSSFQPDTLFAGLLPGDYTVFLQDLNGCVFEKNTSIPVIPPIVAEAQDETLVCGETVLLRPLVASDSPLIWQWSDSTGVLSTSPELLVGTPGIYSFTVTNLCESVSKDINVSQAPMPAEGLIYLPNSFSPNDDGINDCYRGYIAIPIAIGMELLDYDLKIFDRWGELLFETTDINGCWNGHFRGKQMDSEVMVYWLRMRVRNCGMGEMDLFREGEVHLVR